MVVHGIVPAHGSRLGGAAPQIRRVGRRVGALSKVPGLVDGDIGVRIASARPVVGSGRQELLNDPQSRIGHQALVCGLHRPQVVHGHPAPVRLPPAVPDGLDGHHGAVGIASQLVKGCARPLADIEAALGRHHILPAGGVRFGHIRRQVDHDIVRDHPVRVTNKAIARPVPVAHGPAAVQHHRAVPAGGRQHVPQLLRGVGRLGDEIGKPPLLGADGLAWPPAAHIRLVVGRRQRLPLHDEGHALHIVVRLTGQPLHGIVLRVGPPCHAPYMVIRSAVHHAVSLQVAAGRQIAQKDRPAEGKAAAGLLQDFVQLRLPVPLDVVCRSAPAGSCSAGGLPQTA